MAKISTYPSDNSVSLSDKLIGTDAESNKATKNYILGDVLSLFNQPSSLTNFVPYTGSVSDINLGSHNLYASYIEGDEIYSPLLEGDTVHVYSRLELDASTPIALNGNQGTAGFAMLSQGPGLAPKWYDIYEDLVPYSGAINNVDLGSYTITAAQGTFTTIYEGGSKLTSYLQAFSLATQQQATIATAKLVEFETPSFSDTVTMASNVITFNAAGKYMVEVKLRAEHIGGGGDAQLSVWMQYAASFVNNSRQVYTLPNLHIQEFTYSLMVSAATASDTLRVFWSTSNLSAKFIPTVVGGIYPTAPSASINIYKIG